MPTLKEIHASQTKKPLKIASAIKHPGRLTNAAKKHGRTVEQEAKADLKKPKGTIGDAARFYQHVLRPINKKNKK